MNVAGASITERLQAIAARLTDADDAHAVLEGARAIIALQEIAAEAAKAPTTGVSHLSYARGYNAGRNNRWTYWGTYRDHGRREALREVHEHVTQALKLAGHQP